MGNRAVITFDENPTPESIGVYLHWNGGAESIYPFLQALDHYKVRDNCDKPYQLARFVQIVANFFGSTTSLGVGRLKELDCTNGNNGVYVVSRDNGKLTVKRSEGEFIGPLRTFRSFWTKAKVAAEKKQALAHSYNVPDPAKPEVKTLFQSLLEKNDPLFKEEESAVRKLDPVTSTI